MEGNYKNDYDMDEVKKDYDEKDMEVVTVKPQGRMTLWLALAAFTTTMCGPLQFGYQIGVLTGPSSLLQEFYSQSNQDRRGVPLSETAELWLWSTTIAIYCIGGAAGAFSSSYLADILGRKNTMLLVNVFSIMAGLLMGLSYIANSYEMIIIGRLVIGYYAGVSVTVVPLYLAEISPQNLRGAIGTMNQLMITVGILIGQVLGLYVFTTDENWPILLSLTAVPSVVQMFVLPFCPASPRWLFIKKNEEKEARKVLVKLRGTENVEAEMLEIRQEAQEQSETEKVSIMDVLRLRDPAWRRPLIICVCLHLAQQLSGINAIMFYATEVYYQTGMDDDQVAIATVGTGAINVFMTIVAVFVIESAGRKPLLLYPFAAMTIATGLVTMSLTLQDKNDNWKWMSLVLIYLYIVAFAVGPGPIPFLIVPELWAQGPRPAVMSIAVQVNWYSNFIVGLTFPFLQASIEAYAFLFFMSFCLLSTIFVFFYVPETKGRSFQEMVESFQPKGGMAEVEVEGVKNKAYDDDD